MTKDEVDQTVDQIMGGVKKILQTGVEKMAEEAAKNRIPIEQVKDRGAYKNATIYSEKPVIRRVTGISLIDCVINNVAFLITAPKGEEEMEIKIEECVLHLDGAPFLLLDQASVSIHKLREYLALHEDIRVLDEEVKDIGSVFEVYFEGDRMLLLENQVEVLRALRLKESKEARGRLEASREDRDRLITKCKVLAESLILSTGISRDVLSLVQEMTEDGTEDDGA